MKTSSQVESVKKAMFFFVIEIRFSGFNQCKWKFTMSEIHIDHQRQKKVKD